MNENIIAETSDNREALRPIYSSADIRWDELAEWFERNSETVHATIHELTPSERGRWHGTHVLGLDDMRTSWRDIEFPDFPAVPAPAWSTSEDDRGVDCVTDFPVHAFIRDLSPSMTIEQEASFDPGDGSVRWGEPFLSLWLDDGKTEIRMTAAPDARRVSLALREGAAALEAALREVRL